MSLALSDPWSCPTHGVKQQGSSFTEIVRAHIDVFWPDSDPKSPKISTSPVSWPRTTSTTPRITLLASPTQWTEPSSVVPSSY